MKTKTKFPALLALLFCSVNFAPVATRTNASFFSASSLRVTVHSPGLEPSDQSDVRAAVQNIFDQLKAGRYEALYDSLPSSSRARIARDRFVSALQRSRNLYQLDRIEIGAVRVSGNLAVVDTVMYAHMAPPFDADGKLVVQQYLVREGGAWRVATGDRATIDGFLKTNPSFARKFPIKKPQAFINQNGKWVEFDLRGRRPPST